MRHHAYLTAMFLIVTPALAQAQSLIGTTGRIIHDDAGCSSVSAIKSFWGIVGHQNQHTANESVALVNNGLCYIFTQPAVSKLLYITRKGFFLEKIVIGQHSGKLLYFNPLSSMIVDPKSAAFAQKTGLVSNAQGFIDFYQHAVIDHIK